MCGIAGIVRSGRSALGSAEMTACVERMTSSIAHRGPDASGIWTDHAGRCALGHRRLSIIDTSTAGRQPMATGDERWWITFNGELYNFQEVRPALQAAGVQLRGRTDTEVLIESIALWGTDAFTRFDGMFAFGAFDTASGELILARDPFGEKPLYYMEMPGGDFAFASELQALERLPGFDGSVDVDAVAEVLSFQYIGAPRSIYASVKKLPPAHWLRRDAQGKITTGRYYQFKPGLSGFSDRPINDLADELEEILTRSIRRRLIADVPLGAFLSGGVDSSTVCALVRRKLNLPLTTFSTGFGGAPESEHLTARVFAQHLGTDHHEEILTPDAADFLLHIGSLLDEPNGDSSCLPTYLLSRFARRHVTVAVSGDGGDEMFGGYGRYFATYDELIRHRSGELPNWTPGGVYFGNRILISAENHLAELLGFVPDKFAAHLARLRAEVDEAQDQLLCGLRRSDVDNYMPGAVLAKVDRMSMQHSLEVRTPFLNTEIARFAERLPDSMLIQSGRGKPVLRQVAYRYLPRELIDLPKQGFGLPMSDWARTSLLDVAGKLIESDDSRLRSMLGDRGISRFLRRQRTPGQFSAYQVWCVAMLESWLRHHPVTLPSLADRQTRGHRENALVAAPVGKGMYILAHHAIRRPADAADSALLILPEPGEPLTDHKAKELAALRGSTMLCLREEPALDYGFQEFSKFQKLGLARVIFPHPHDDERYNTIDMRSHNLLKRLWSLFRLIPHAIGLIANRRLAAPLGPIRFESTENLNSAGPVLKLDARKDVDLVDSYMVFEGTRQLPPVQVSHSDIQSKGQGRYSVWNQSVYFSATDPERLYKYPYWIFPLNDSTRAWLQFAPGRIQSKLEVDAASVLENFIMSFRTPPLGLNRGDAVVVCTHGLSPGGAERQWVYLAQALAKAGFAVSFVVYNPLSGLNAHYLPSLEKFGIRVIAADRTPLARQASACAHMPGMANLLASDLLPQKGKLIRLAATFAEIKPKVVFAQLDEPNIMAGFAAHLADVPRVVMSFRNYIPTNFPYIDKDWYLGAYRALSISDRVIFSGNHRDANADYAAWIGIPDVRVAHVPNVIDTEEFPLPTDQQLLEARTELELTAETPMLLGAFRLEQEKGAPTFVDVCARLIKDIPELRAFILGVGPLKAELEERIERLGLGRNLRLLGRRSDVNVLMKLASVFLLPSAKEGMPNVLMEAQLMGTAIVATRTGGTPDTVINGETAVLADVGDVEALAGACAGLLREPDRARRMGAAGRRHALAAFPKEAVADHYLDLVRGDTAWHHRVEQNAAE
jgi:asparagine synthase (glutamine-hydrolysing)